MLMKKRIVFIFILALSFSICGCNTASKTEQASDKYENLISFLEQENFSEALNFIYAMEGSSESTTKVSPEDYGNFSGLISLLEKGKYDDAMSYVLLLMSNPTENDKTLTYWASTPDTSQDQTIKLENPVTILDNEYLKLEIVEEFQVFMKSTDRLEKGITIKATNKYDKKLDIRFRDTYSGENEVRLTQDGGKGEMPEAGKVTYLTYYTRRILGSEDTPIEDIHEIYNMEGKIEVHEYYEPKASRYLDIFSFSLS